MSRIRCGRSSPDMLRAMPQRHPGSRQAAALTLASLLGAAGLAALAWTLDPDVVQHHFSGDGELGPVTARWLGVYARVAWGLAALMGALAAAGLLRRRALERMLARSPLALPRIVLACAALALGLLGAELAVRALGWGHSSSSTNTTAARDYSHQFMQSIRIQLDDRGYRETRWDRPAPPGVGRILVLGDSFVFGFGVSALEDTFPAALERELAAGPGAPRCEVLNLGLPGADSAGEAAVLQELLPEVAPDLVLIGYYVNDCETPDEKIAFFGSRRLLPLLSDNLELISDLWRFVESEIVWQLEAAGLRITYAEHLREQALPGSDAWGQHRSDLRRLLEQAGRPAAMVIFPLLTNEDPYPLAALHEQVAQVAAEAGVPVLDLRESLDGLLRDEIQVASFDPHLNARGLALTATATARFLEQEGLVPAPP